MPFMPFHAAMALAVPLLQDAVIPPPARVPLPRPAASAPVVAVNQNLFAAGRRGRDTLTVALDVVEAAVQAEGSDDPVVRILALTERGRTPQVPGPPRRVPVGTTGGLTLRNASGAACGTRSPSRSTWSQRRSRPRAATIPWCASSRSRSGERRHRCPARCYAYQWGPP